MIEFKFEYLKQRNMYNIIELEWFDFRYDKKIEAEMAKYDPWGKGGAGAPLRDVATGQVIGKNTFLIVGLKVIGS